MDNGYTTATVVSVDGADCHLMTENHDQFQMVRQLHWTEYGVKELGTAFLSLLDLVPSSLTFGQASLEQLIPNKSIRLLITGLMFAGSGSLVAITTRKLSGGHVNPAVSTCLLVVQGKMHQHDICGYIIDNLSALLVQCCW